MQDSELAALLSDLESDRVERKSSLADGERIREAICAFANALTHPSQPGILFIGATDDGRAAGLAITDELLLKVAALRDDGQRFRVGLEIARSALAANGNPPLELKVTPGFVFATLRSAR